MSDAAGPLLREFTDAELGAAVRLILADPNFGQHDEDHDWLKLLETHAKLVRLLRTRYRRAWALVAAFEEVYKRHACDEGSIRVLLGLAKPP